VGEPEDAPGVIVAHVARQLARARDRPNKPVFDTRAPGHDPDALEPGLDRCGFEQQSEDRIELLAEALQPSAAMAEVRSKAAPPGRTRPLP
jgi:hypothetical protein